MTTATSTIASRLERRVGLPRRPRSARLSLFRALAAAVMLGVLTLSGECRAGGLVISAPDITAAPGSSGEFLVLLTNTNPSGGVSYDVAGDSFELRLSGGSGVTFTDVAIPSTGSTPYIYSASTDVQQGFPLYTESSNPFPTTDFTAGDTFDLTSSPGYTLVNPGDVYALGLVSYSIDSTATPGTVVSIGFVDAGMSLSDQNGDSIGSSTTAGSITVTASTPEPSSWIMAATAIGIFLIIRLRRRLAINLGPAA